MRLGRAGHRVPPLLGRDIANVEQGCSSVAEQVLYGRLRCSRLGQVGQARCRLQAFRFGGRSSLAHRKARHQNLRSRGPFLGGGISQLVASRNPRGLKGLVLVAPAPPSPLRFTDEAREIQIHAYDNRENVLQTISFLSARTPSPDIVGQIVEDSMSGSRVATMAFPMGSILEDISSEASKIRVPTLVLAGELDRLDSVDQHRHEVVARIQTHAWKSSKAAAT
jgi:hypothetical protein